MVVLFRVYKRAWIIDQWLEYIEKQTFPLKDIGFVFELGNDDDETHNKLWAWHAKHPEVELFDGVIRCDIKHSIHPVDGRTWTKSAYSKMTDFRNALLNRVRAYQPDRYYSLDSDILLEDPDTIVKLVELTEDFDAVDTLSYMTPKGTKYPSAMSWKSDPGGVAFRGDYPIGEVFQCDVIMASKMMSPLTFNKVNYEWHRQGEDLGWSTQCGRAGLRLACASNLYTMHVMHEHMLEPYLKNGDSRSTNKLV